MIRKYICGAFAAIAALLLMLLPALAQENEMIASGECGTSGNNLSWTLDINGLLTITGSGLMADYTEESRAPWSSFGMEIIAVNVEAGVEHIGDHAFMNLRGLGQVALPEGVVSIGSYAFSDCYSLEMMELPEGVSTIGDCAFARCYSLNSIVLPASIEAMGTAVFDECSELTAVVVKDSYAHNWCRQNGVSCSADEEAQSEFQYTIQNGAVTITGYSGTDMQIEVPETVEDCPVTAIAANAFADLYDLQAITLPGGIAAIGESAFARCYNLSELNLPEAVASIGEGAFDDCFSLTVKVTSNSFAHNWCIANNVECEVNGEQKIDFEYSITDGNATITVYNGSEDEVTIPSVVDGYPVTAVGANVFADCYDLQTVILPESIAVIGENAFARCYILSELTLPASVTAIGESAFDDCFSLVVKVTSNSYAHNWCIDNNVNCELIDAPKRDFEYTVTDGQATITVYTGSEDQVTIPSVVEGYPVTAIGANAFADQYSLQTVSLPDGIAAIGENAFARCYNLNELNLPEAVASIGDGAFDDCFSLTVSVVANSYAHNWCTANNVNCSASGAQKIEFEYSVTDGKATITLYNGSEDEVIIPPEVDGYPVMAIGANAFADQYSLQKVSLPESIAVIGENAFIRCYNLCELNLPLSVSSIGNQAFEQCYSLTVTVVAGSYAHEWCRNNGIFFKATGSEGEEVEPEPELKTLVLPAALKVIDSYAFENAAAEMIILPEGCVSIGEYAFAHNISLQKIYMPDSVSEIAESAFAGCGDVAFICESENDAAAFAAENGFEYQIAGK